ncbi:hypothetical protein PFISCL1PPCAC_11886, partial [Pristionchus fissidentatus]
RLPAVLVNAAEDSVGEGGEADSAYRSHSSHLRECVIDGEHVSVNSCDNADNEETDGNLDYSLVVRQHAL